MFSTLGVILMVFAALASSLGTLGLQKWLRARRARLRSQRVSVATRQEPAPPMWESRLAELQAEVVSLSSSFEKVTKVVTRQNARSAMRDHRAASSQEAPPPVGADKAELYRHYGLAGKTPRQIAQHQLDLETSNNGRPN